MDYSECDLLTTYRYTGHLDLQAIKIYSTSKSSGRLDILGI